MAVTELAPTVLDGIGHTPLIPVDGVWAKLEYLNPSGSIKARMAKWTVERAEADGRLRPGDTIVEASSGNTGNALAMVAAVKGYHMVVVIPEGMSPERAYISRALGAEVREVGHFHVNTALQEAHRLASQPGWFCPSQFDSEDNVEENRLWLGPEILEQLPGHAPPDALVLGVGTGGTLVGVGQAFRAANPSCRLVAVEPQESRTIACGEVGEHLVEGIADGFVPGILRKHRDLVDEVVSVTSDEALEEMHRLVREHGLLVGPSSGANLLAARRVMARAPELATVVTVLADEAEKYLHDHFSGVEQANRGLSSSAGRTPRA